MPLRRLEKEKKNWSIKFRRCAIHLVVLVDSFVGHWANWLINAVRCYLVTARNPADCFLLFYRNSQLWLQEGIVVVEAQSRRTAGKWRIKRLMTSDASWELLPLSCPMCPSVISKINPSSSLDTLKFCTSARSRQSKSQAALSQQPSWRETSRVCRLSLKAAGCWWTTVKNTATLLLLFLQDWKSSEIVYVCLWDIGFGFLAFSIRKSPVVLTVHTVYGPELGRRWEKSCVVQRRSYPWVISKEEIL